MTHCRHSRMLVRHWIAIQCLNVLHHNQHILVTPEATQAFERLYFASTLGCGSGASRTPQAGNQIHETSPAPPLRSYNQAHHHLLFFKQDCDHARLCTVIRQTRDQARL